MMSFQDRPQTEADDEELEDLEATEKEADDLTGGINKLPGKPKPGEITLTRSTDE